MSAGAPPTTIRDAYKKAALKTHPDRVPAESPERAARTRKFQLVNDAYYTLSDPTRRREYDAQRRMYGFSGGRSNAAPPPTARREVRRPIRGRFRFRGHPLVVRAQRRRGRGRGRLPLQLGVELLHRWAGRAEYAAAAPADRERAVRRRVRGDAARGGPARAGERRRQGGKLWSVAGGVSGGVLGFILANFPGLMAGAVAGNRLGAVRGREGQERICRLPGPAPGGSSAAAHAIGCQGLQPYGGGLIWNRQEHVHAYST
ncbi:uncharacterized protein PG998_001532 [Apiospora kogelbergensis]|uniref:uncharacterized protein n=1 Tax=Apiospora kogelbergensis TaxID=1337665 RepID=UPI00313028E9